MNPFQVGVMPAFCSAALGPRKYSSTTALMGLAEERISLDTILSAGRMVFPDACLLVNTILTLTTRGVGVRDGVFVRVAVKEGVVVGVLLGVNVGVSEGVNVVVGDGVKVGVLNGVAV